MPHIRMFSDYLDDNWPSDVPDPYYGEEDGFDQVLDMLEEGCPVILQTRMCEGSFYGMFEEYHELSRSVAIHSMIGST